MAAPRGNQVRIVAGRWRGRRLGFPQGEGLRPTPDRVRETLFNWLAPLIPGARGLDLFAGSGALGIEALSRGAEQVVFVERNPTVARALRDNLLGLGVESPRVEQADALVWLERRERAALPEPFDLVWLDPPFDEPLLGPVCTALETAGWLAPAARIYLECRAREPLCLPDSWRVIRDKTAGQVAYRLAVRAGG